MSALVARGLRLAQAGPEAPALDLALDAGAICCIVGPPGSGRAAWLRTLAAIEPPAAGELRLAGREVAELDQRGWRALRREVGFVSTTRTPLLSGLDGLANVTLAADYHRLADPEANRHRARALLQRLGWRGPLDVLPAWLEEHHRLTLVLARCLMLDPRILFLHEPFRMVDLAARRDFAALLGSLAREARLALVVVTQHLDFVRRWADRILFIGRAGIVEHGGWAAFAGAPVAEIRDFLRLSGAEEGA